MIPVPLQTSVDDLRLLSVIKKQPRFYLGFFLLLSSAPPHPTAKRPWERGCADAAQKQNFHFNVSSNKVRNCSRRSEVQGAHKFDQQQNGSKNTAHTGMVKQIIEYSSYIFRSVIEKEIGDKELRNILLAYCLALASASVIHQNYSFKFKFSFC